MNCSPLFNFNCSKTSGSGPGPGPGGGHPLDFEFVPIGTYDDCNEAEDELGDGWECYDFQKDIYVEIPSDGVVTAESAAAMPNVGKQIEMEGSNHFQMRNDMELQDKLTKLFKGGHGQWFFLEKQ